MLNSSIHRFDLTKKKLQSQFVTIVRLITLHTELDKHMPTNDQIDALLVRYMVMLIGRQFRWYFICCWLFSVRSFVRSFFPFFAQRWLRTSYSKMPALRPVDVQAQLCVRCTRCRHEHKWNQNQKIRTVCVAKTNHVRCVYPSCVGHTRNELMNILLAVFLLQ